MYEIREGKILTQACEVPVTHHCHLSCRSCSHLSPHAQRHFASADTVFRDLSVLARWYAPSCVRLLGGEPLMHRDIVDVIAAVRASGVAPRIRVVTNGVLLPRMSARFWEAVDEVLVSVYPGYELSPADVEYCAELAVAHGVELRARYYDRFRESTCRVRHTDAELVRRIFTTCQIAHVWRCHTADNGFFYKCPQSLFIPKVLGNGPLPEANPDALQIVDTPAFGDELLAFLQAAEQLSSCSNCLGSVGRRFAHQQEPRNMIAEWNADPQGLVDYSFLATLENNAQAGDPSLPEMKALTASQV